VIEWLPLLRKARALAPAVQQLIVALLDLIFTAEDPEAAARAALYELKRRQSFVSRMRAKQ
jgi:hypothetical protein